MEAGQSTAQHMACRCGTSALGAPNSMKKHQAEELGALLEVKPSQRCARRQESHLEVKIVKDCLCFAWQAHRIRDIVKWQAQGFVDLKRILRDVRQFGILGHDARSSRDSICGKGATAMFQISRFRTCKTSYA